MRARNPVHGFGFAVLSFALFLPVVVSASANLQLVTVTGGSNPSSLGGNGDSYAPIITPDGRYVLFASTANNLVPTNSDGPVTPTGILNVYLRDRLAETTTLVSVSMTGAGADGASLPTGISTNGQYALFESEADNLAPGCSNDFDNVFIRDFVNHVTTLASIGTSGGGGNGKSYDSTMTPDGRFVVFASDADNLIPSDTNQIADVFVRDLQIGTTTLVSTGATGTLISPGSVTPQITPDGRFVAFFSMATNLVPGVASAGEIYVRDLLAGTTVWASTNARSLFQAQFGTANDMPCDPVISSNGQFVAFYVCPTNAPGRGLVLEANLQSLIDTIVSTNAFGPLTAAFQDVADLAITPDGNSITYLADGNSNPNSGTNTVVYLWNAQAGTNELISADITTDLPGAGTCSDPVINSSGTLVAFLSNGTNLTANALSCGFQLYLWNVQTGVMELVDATTNGIGVGLSVASSAALSDDGSTVAFDLALNNGSLAPGDNNRGSEVFACHPATNAIELISGCLVPTQTPNDFVEFYGSCLSTNGRYLAFSSEAGDLMDGVTNEWRQIFVRDLLIGTNILVSADTNGLPATTVSTEPCISGNGRYVAFSSFASSLVTGLTISNTENIYLRDLQSGTTALVSVSLNGNASGNGDAWSPAVSTDGRYVLFHSTSTNLAPGFTSQNSGIENLFLRDEQLATNYALTTGISAPGVMSASMTPDGHYVAFIGATNGGSQRSLYLWNSQTASVIWNYTPNTATASNVCISPDGSWVAYASGSSLWAQDPTGAPTKFSTTGSFDSHSAMQISADDTSLVYVNTNDVYLANLTNETFIVVSRSYNSTNPASGISSSPVISPDGRFIVYRSTATNIIPYDTGGLANIYLYDRMNDATTLISINLAGNGVANNWSREPEFSADGSTLTFQSYSSDLASQAFNEYGAVFALNLASFTGTNSSGMNAAFSAQIGESASSGQSLAAANPVIEWSGTPGGSYQVQFANSLNNPDWQPVNGNVVFIGNNAQMVDLSPAAGQRFYRIVLTNP